MTQEPIATPATEHAGEPPTRRVGRWLWGFVVVGLAIRLPLLFDSVWFDEACMSTQRIGTFEQLLATVYVDTQPPLFIAFMHLWNSIFGDSEWALRIPALVAGLLAIPMVFWCGRRLVGDTAALWASALLALSPAHIWYSAEAAVFTPAVLCTLFLVYTFERIIVGGTQSRLIRCAHVLNIVVMLALHYYLSTYIVLLACIAPVVARGFTRHALGVLVWHGFGIVLLAAFVYFKEQLGSFATTQDTLRPLTVERLGQLLFIWNWTGDSLHTLGLPEVLTRWLPQGLLIGLMVLGMVRILSRQVEHRLGLYVPVFMLTIPGFFVISAWAGLGHYFIERTFLPSLPFLLLMAGAGIAALAPRVRPFVGGTAALIAAVAVSALLWNRHDTVTVHRPKPDWRSASAWLSEQIDGDGSGRPVFTSMPNPRPLSYYDVRIQDVETLTPPTTSPKIADKVARVLGTGLGQLAADTFEGFANHKRELLESAQLRVYGSDSDPAKLELQTRMRADDDVCYLVRNRWHPSIRVDSSVEDLLKHPRVTVLERQQFTGVSVYKVRIAP